jgi:uncharacterized membrane protein YbaN (DUF454 family)
MSDRDAADPSLPAPLSGSTPDPAATELLIGEPAQLPSWQRWLLMVLAWISLIVGFIGFVIPGVPGTVFILLSAWAAMHGSPRLHDWLLAHRVFGPVIRDWRANGAVSRKAKHLASLSLAICAASLFLVPMGALARAIALTCIAAVLVWLWRRPEPA